MKTLNHVEMLRLVTEHKDYESLGKISEDSYLYAVAKEYRKSVGNEITMSRAIEDVANQCYKQIARLFTDGIL